MSKIIPVILSGGSGTRLWPLSRKEYPKQYLPLVGDNTMLQETILRLEGLDYLNQSESSSAEFNLGNCNGFSVKEVIQQVKNITGKDFKVLEEGRRDGDPSTLIASDSKAKKELNLSSDYSSLESIIKTLD